MREDGERREASFNMAVATLSRLDGILKRMEIVSEMTSGLREQRLHIKLLRHFFMNATPLLKLHLKAKEFAELQKRVLSVKIPQKTIKGKRIEYYNPNLDDDIMELLMDVQGEIKEHFMPHKGEDNDDDI
jgi:hypothetical protein